MASTVEDGFSNWLIKKLQDLNTDETVFGSYITGILDSDETVEEKKEALEGILSEILSDESSITNNCSEILDKWQLFKPKDNPSEQLSNEDMNEKLAKLLESQSLATTKQKQYTEEEKKIRDAILSQYSQMTDSEDEDNEQAATGSGELKENGLEKNLNFQTVQLAEKEKREQAKIESQKKKEKDKEDREKQKKEKEEKKDKRKTQKGERRR